MADQWIVEGSGLGEPGQVVEVSCNRDPPIAGELLSDRLLHPHHRKGREGESLPTVDDLGHRLDDLGGQAEPVARELQLRSDVRSSERRLDPQVPQAVVVAHVRDREPEAVDGDTVERLKDIESDGLLGCTEVEVGGEVPGRYESRWVPWVSRCQLAWGGSPRWGMGL